MRTFNILHIVLAATFFVAMTALMIVGCPPLSVVEQTQQSTTAPAVRITRSRGVLGDRNEYYSFDAFRADGTVFHLFTTSHLALGSTGYMPLRNIGQATQDSVFAFCDDMYAVTVNSGRDWTVVNMSNELKVDSGCHALILDVQFDLHGSATVPLAVQCSSSPFSNERAIGTTDYGRTWHEVPQAHNNGVNLTVWPVTRLAPRTVTNSFERRRARRAPVQPAGYAGRYAH